MLSRLNKLEELTSTSGLVKHQIATLLVLWAIGNLHAQIEHGLSLQRFRCNSVLQRHTVQKFHDYEWLPFVLADFMDRADIWMVQGRGRSRFAPKSFERLRIMGDIVGQEFERDEAPKLSVFCFVDDTHPTPAELLDDPVVRNRLADKLRRRGHWQK